MTAIDPIDLIPAEMRGRLWLDVPVAGRLCFGLGREKSYEEANRFIETRGAEGMPAVQVGRRIVSPVPMLLERMGIVVAGSDCSAFAGTPDTASDLPRRECNRTVGPIEATR